MKIFNSTSIKEIEYASCEQQNINSLELMERTAAAIIDVIINRFGFIPSKRFVVVAGPGNNGGDALAVARMLIEQGFRNVEIFLFNVKGKLSPDCEEEKRRLIAIDNVDFTEITKEFSPPYLCEKDVVIDGLFGSGLREPMQGGFMSLARYINESGAYTISIDIPSGLFEEWNHNINRRDVIHANLTLAVEFPRLSFFFEENEHIIGDWDILSIDLSKEKIQSTPTNFIIVEPQYIKNKLHPRRKFSGKRDYGSVLLMAGRLGMMGAAVMAAKAAMRTGAGLVTVHAPRCGMNILQTAIPEVMFEPDKNERSITDMTFFHDHQAIAIGPGIGCFEETINALERMFKSIKTPLILDADALNCISIRPTLLPLIPPFSIITPHIGEFDRLFGEHNSSEERLKKAISMSQQYNIIIVLKGHYTTIVRPDGRVYINSSGNPGMATAGAGDVLTGIIAALMAQGYKPELASVIGVYVHGLAGDLAVEQTGEYGLIASDIIDNIGKAIRYLIKSKK